MSRFGSLLAVAVAVMVAAAAGLPATVVEENEVDYRHHLKVQHEELKALSCQPRPGKVNIRNELQFTDYLLDETFFPEVVSVSRCWESCTFCGNLHTGQPKGRCLPHPDGIVKRPFYVYYFKNDERVFRRVLLTEHTSCQCS